MPLTGEMLNAQGNATCKKEAPTISPEYGSFGITAAEVTPEETTAPARKIKKTGHGLNTEDLVVFTELNGKTTLGESVGGLIIGAPYWAHKVSTSEFAVAFTKAQSASATEGEWVEWTVTIKATTKLVKITEGTIAARVKLPAFGAAANGANEAAAVEVESTAAQTAAWNLCFSAISAGTLTLVEKASEAKVLASGDLYKITKTLVQQTGYII